MEPSINQWSKPIANHAGAVKFNISHAGPIPAVVFVIGSQKAEIKWVLNLTDVFAKR